MIRIDSVAEKGTFLNRSNLLRTTLTHSGESTEAMERRTAIMVIIVIGQGCIALNARCQATESTVAPTVEKIFHSRGNRC